MTRLRRILLAAGVAVGCSSGSGHPGRSDERDAGLGGFVAEGASSGVPDFSDSGAVGGRLAEPGGGGASAGDTSGTDLSGNGGASAGDSGAVPPGGSIGSAGTAGGADPGAAPYAGFWRGITSQDRVIEFVVDGIGLMEWRYGWALALCSSETVTTFAAPVLIVDGRLERSVPAPAGISTTMIIEFASPTTATGSVTFTLRPAPGSLPPGYPACQGTETATFTAER